MPRKFNRLMSAAIEARQRLEGNESFDNVATPTEAAERTIGRLAIAEEISQLPVEMPPASTPASIGRASLKLASESA